MAIPKSPFAGHSSMSGATTAGNGHIRLSLLPPGHQVLNTFKYQYPLKLVAPHPHHVHVPADAGAGAGADNKTANGNGVKNKQVTVVFLLTYGGGLVGGDKIDLKIELDPCTKMVLVTQGSTKLFKCVSRSVISQQMLEVKIGAGAALCYLPDPTQPFAQSLYEQRQTFYVEPNGTSSLLMLDWVSEGRAARGESWQMWGWKGRNEVRCLVDDKAKDSKGSKNRLLLRDAFTLSDAEGGGGMDLEQKTDGMGILGTLIIYGAVFASLGEFFIKHMAEQPRIGTKNFSGQFVQQEHHQPPQKEDDGLLWTVAKVRGFVLVKFGAKGSDSARQWLGRLLKAEGTVERQFGHQALLCFR